MCGVFGIKGVPKAAEMTFLGLHAMQHRAKEYAGIVTSDSQGNLFRHSGQGIVQDVFDTERLNELFGADAIGHIRYSTTEDNPRKDNTQPIMDGDVALCHNGNLTNVKTLIRRLRRKLGTKPLFRTSMDSEILLRRYVAAQAKDPLGKVLEMLKGVTGSYSLLLLTKNTMIAVRDPWGNRPLWVGQRNGGWLFASESVAFENLGKVANARELLPGEIMIVYPDNSTATAFWNGHELSDQPDERHGRQQCAFELLYFAHPASTLFGINVAIFRKAIGRRLEQVAPASAQQVLAVPDSAVYFGLGYASAPHHRYEIGIARSHYIGRSFIEGLQELRVNKAVRKFTVIRSLVQRAVTLIDDSIVRLTTLPRVIKLLRAAGVREIHVRIGTPPIIAPCRYGIDTPRKAELVAARKSPAQIGQQCQVESLEFLPLPELQKVIASFRQNPKDFCYACMTGKYIIPVPDFRPQS